MSYQPRLEVLTRVTDAELSSLGASADASAAIERADPKSGPVPVMVPHETVHSLIAEVKMARASLDIECEDWDRFTVGGLRYHNGQTFVTWDPDELFFALLDIEGDVWTWAGARYDTLWVTEMAAIHGVPCIATMSGGVIALKIGKCTVRDGYRLYPTSLRVAAELTDVPKASTELPCRCPTPRASRRLAAIFDARGIFPSDYKAHVRAAREHCGGYCSIRQRGMAPVEKRKLEAYLQRDLEVTSKAIEALHDFAQEHGIVIKSTVAASAWATMRQGFGLPEAVWHAWRDYVATRAGYYGGRCEMYRRTAPLIHRADIHAAYPGALINVPVPVGDYKHVFGHHAVAKAFERGTLGVYAAIVKAPEVHVPPLPVRVKSRLLFPVGVARGSWTGLELAHALECGARILRFEHAMTWSRGEAIAKPFMEKFWKLRHDLGKKSALGGFVKFLCNAPTGGFALKPEGEKCMVSPEKVKACPADIECDGTHADHHDQQCCERRCTRRCGAWSPVGPRGVVWSAPMHQLSDRSHIAWAAYLTAATRIELHKQQLSVGDALVYSDTDSCYATKLITRGLGEDVGQWSDEGWGLDWYARGPKAYRYADAETGEYQVRAKGVPGLDAVTFDAWAQGKSVALPGGVWGFKGAAIRGGALFKKKTGADGGPYKRSAISSMDYAGGRRVHADGTTSPLSVKEYERLRDEGVMS